MYEAYGEENYGSRQSGTQHPARRGEPYEESVIYESGHGERRNERKPNMVFSYVFTNRRAVCYQVHYWRIEEAVDEKERRRHSRRP